MIRPFRLDDALDVNRIAVLAFSEHRSSYTDWAGLRERLCRMADHASDAEILVAEHAGEVAGAVIYVAPDRGRPAHFDPDWALIRMLAVDPKRRGAGLGKALVEACLACAIRDRASVIALHTSPGMQTALRIYRGLGFDTVRPAPDNFGAPCSILARRLTL